MINRKHFVLPLTCLSLFLTAQPPAKAGSVVVWGDNSYGQTDVPPAAQSGIVAVAAGDDYVLALKDDGTLVTWGKMGDGSVTAALPAGMSNVVAIAAAGSLCLALKRNGSVESWGNWGYFSHGPAAEGGVKAIATGGAHALFLNENGSVSAWGWGDNGQTTIPPSITNDVIAIAAGDTFSLALKRDGSVVAWGSNGDGEREVPATAQSGVTAIAAGRHYGLALKSNGSVVAWGAGDDGPTTIPPEAETGVSAVSAGPSHAAAIKNGSVIAWGDNSNGQSTVPLAARSGVIQIAAGGYPGFAFTVALIKDSQDINMNFMAAPGSKQAALSWKGGEGMRFNIRRATSATGPLTLIATNYAGTNLLVTNLNNGSFYYFTLSSVSGEFESLETPRLRVGPSAPLLDLLPAGAKLEKLASGFITTFGGLEGPVWHPSSHSLWFADNSGNKIVRWTPGSGATTERLTPRPNGQALDLQGRVLTCEQSSRTITRTEADGTVTPLVTLYDGKTFNEPNDVVVKSDGTVWFTDPAYINKATQPGNYVYRFSPENGNATVSRVSPTLGHPNGLCFSPDETRLFVTDTDGQVRVFDVLPDNSLTNNRPFIPITADGIRTTPNGRFFACSGNVMIYDLDGKSLGELAVPENAANLCFGGTNGEMLFITASSSLYGITRMPDLVVTAINPFPIKPIEGQSVLFRVIVKNQGTAPTTGELPTRISFAVNGETNVIAFDEFTNSIPPDASIVVTAKRGADSFWRAQRGTNVISASIDSFNAQQESQETNNSLSVKLIVAGVPVDSDGDGSSDSDETIAGTNATEVGSVLKIVQAVALTDGHLVLTWTSLPGKTYRVSRQQTLANPFPTEFANQITATTDSTSWTNSLASTGSASFFRINVVP